MKIKFYARHTCHFRDKGFEIKSPRILAILKKYQMRRIFNNKIAFLEYAAIRNNPEINKYLKKVFLTKYKKYHADYCHIFIYEK